jgi:RNA polymerase sigma factor (sigma-70 family)
MTDTTWVALRRRLVERYEELRILLTRRLGSEDLARETLHETWLRLDRVEDVAVMRNPDAYLARVALNLATDRQRLETSRARRSEVTAILEDIADDVPGQAEKLETRADLAIFVDAIRELSERRRAILIAARLDEEPHQKIAERFGISKRMVQIELKYALKHCKDRLEQKS